ncbi:uncharacterized protein DUF3572 [Aliiruegeria haliotis]|uniref:Uncharacterized protein DUF3572 n=1 Tax=Aliiruegeria haliotis TaxID=1280846 RepID=A0A2T0RUU0_9RHOB|nr:DUF3572 domain-containing protein [Aliiruegeria haliotis]PRY24908.1 uncharacterized protein DUF3572 [Aliiruegeria haliotis]
MKQESAETLALTALAWLAGSDDMLPVFLGATGASLDDVKNRAQDPEFLASVLDFLIMDDAWIAAFSESTGVPLEAPLEARQALPGGLVRNWT